MIIVVNTTILFRVQSGKTKGTIVKGLTNIYHKEGLRAYWNGNGANVIKIMPESALRFLSYEAFKSGICQARLKGGVGLMVGFLSQYGVQVYLHRFCCFDRLTGPSVSLFYRMYLVLICFCF